VQVDLFAIASERMLSIVITCRVDINEEIRREQPTTCLSRVRIVAFPDDFALGNLEMDNEWKTKYTIRHFSLRLSDRIRILIQHLNDDRFALDVECHDLILELKD
jgi:hypothetical protein